MFFLFGRNIDAAALTPEDCSRPQSGLWTIELFEPPTNPVLVVTGYVLLTSTFEDAYEGNSLSPYKSVHFCVGLAELYAVGYNTPLRMEVVAIFDPESCVLYGSMTHYELKVVDEFKWSCQPHNMVGVYVATTDGEMDYDDYCLHSLELLEETNETDFDNALYAYLRDQDRQAEATRFALYGIDKP